MYSCAGCGLCNARQNKMRMALPGHAEEKPCSGSPHGLFSHLLWVLVFEVRLPLIPLLNFSITTWFPLIPLHYFTLPYDSYHLIYNTFIYVFYLLFAFINIEQNFMRSETSVSFILCCLVGAQQIIHNDQILIHFLGVQELAFTRTCDSLTTFYNFSGHIS